MEKTWRQRIDSWKNALTGLGGSRDKRMSAVFERSPDLTDPVLDELYHNNDLAGLICDTFPEEALRQGFTLKIEDPDLRAEVQARSEELGVAKACLEAAVWGNVFGAGCVFVGAEDGQSVDRPLVPERVRAVRYLTVLDKRDLVAYTWYADPLKPNYGRPETYRFTNYLSAREQGKASLPAGQVIHETRLLFFYGSRTAKRRVLENKGWPHSKLQKVYDVIRDFDIGWQGAAYLLQEASQAVYGVKDLLDMIASDEGQTLLEKRMRTIDMGRSVARALVIDADGETFERKPTSFTGVPELLDRFCSRLAAATRIPVTILMGQSPAGLSATGASDIRQFYDRIKGYQEDVMGPALEIIVRMLILEASGGKEPDNWSVEFPSLYQPTQLETADLRAKQAATDKTYIDAQVLTPEEVALSRFPAEGWSMETVIDLELRESLQELEAKNMLENKENPPVPVNPGEPGETGKSGEPTEPESLGESGEEE